MSASAHATTVEFLGALSRARPPLQRRALAALALCAGLALGALFAPHTVAPERVGNVMHWGGWPLESAFSAMVLVAALMTFRVVENLYRAHDAAALRPLPLSGLAFALDRLRISCSEGALAALVIAAFIVPAASRDGGLVSTLAALGFITLTGPLLPLLAFAVVVRSGTAALAGADERSASTSGLYHLAPGVAFGVCAGVLLLMKLGFEEPLRVASEGQGARLTRAFWVAVGLPVAGILALGVSSLRAYSRRHDSLQAHFVDAENALVRAGGAELGGSGAAESRVERALGGPAALLYRKDRLQLVRGAAFLRAGTWFITGLAVFVGWASGGTFSALATGMCLATWLVVVVSPHRRAVALPGESPYGLADMLCDAPIRRRARRAASAAETWGHTLPLLGGGIGFGLAGAMVIAAIVGSAAAGLVLAMARLPASEPARLGVALLAVGSTVIALALSPYGGTLSLLWGAAAVLALFDGARPSPTDGSKA